MVAVELQNESIEKTKAYEVSNFTLGNSYIKMNGFTYIQEVTHTTVFRIRVHMHVCNIKQEVAKVGVEQPKSIKDAAHLFLV